MGAGLFEKPYDYAEIDRISADDKFLIVATIACGVEPRWQAASDELVSIREHIAEQTLYRLAAVLFLRAYAHKDPKASRNALVQKMPFIDKRKVEQTMKHVQEQRWWRLANPCFSRALHG